jgi:hypothetical protein
VIQKVINHSQANRHSARPCGHTQLSCTAQPLCPRFFNQCQSLVAVTTDMVAPGPGPCPSQKVFNGWTAAPPPEFVRLAVPKGCTHRENPGRANRIIRFSAKSLPIHRLGFICEPFVRSLPGGMELFQALSPCHSLFCRTNLILRMRLCHTKI